MGGGYSCCSVIERSSQCREVIAWIIDSRGIVREVRSRVYWLQYRGRVDRTVDRRRNR